MAVLPPQLLAAGKGEPIVFVADSRRLQGWQAWLTNLYNESHFLFTLVTLIVIPVVGVALGLATDFLMARIGIDLKTRTVAER